MILCTWVGPIIFIIGQSTAVPLEVGMLYFFSKVELHHHRVPGIQPICVFLLPITELDLAIKMKRPLGHSFWFCREPQMSRSKDFNTPFWTTTVQLSDSWDALLIKPNNFSGWICYVLGPGNYIIGEGRVLQLHHGIWVGTVNLNSDHRISSILQNYPKINQGKYRKT